MVPRPKLRSFHFNEDEKEHLLYYIDSLTENQKLIFSSPKNTKEVIALKEKLWSQILFDFVAVYPAKMGVTIYNLKNLYQNVKRSARKKDEDKQQQQQQQQQQTSTGGDQLETSMPFFDDMFVPETTTSKNRSYKRKGRSEKVLNDQLQQEVLLAWKLKLQNEDEDQREIAALKKQKLKLQIENNIEIAALQKRKLLMEIENLQQQQQQKPNPDTYHQI